MLSETKKLCTLCERELDRNVWEGVCNICFIDRKEPKI